MKTPTDTAKCKNKKCRREFEKSTFSSRQLYCPECGKARAKVLSRKNSRKQYRLKKEALKVRRGQYKKRTIEDVHPGTPKSTHYAAICGHKSVNIFRCSACLRNITVEDY